MPVSPEHYVSILPFRFYPSNKLHSTRSTYFALIWYTMYSLSPPKNFRVPVNLKHRSQYA